MITVVRSNQPKESLLTYQEAIRLPSGTPFQFVNFSPLTDSFLVSTGDSGTPLIVFFDTIVIHDGSFNRDKNNRFRILPPITITFQGDK